MPVVAARDDPTVDSRPAVPSEVHGWLAVRLTVASILAVVAGTASLWPLLRTDVLTGTVNLLVVVSFVVTGVVLAEDGTQRRTARDMALAAAFYLVAWWWTWPAAWLIGPFPLIGSVCGYLWFVFGGLALVRYPEPRLRYWYERWCFLLLATWVVGAKIFLAFCSRIEWHEWPHGAGAWWPALAPDPVVYRWATLAYNVGIVVLALSVLALLFGKLGKVRGMDRLDAVPVLTAACAVTVLGTVYLFGRLVTADRVAIDTLRTVTAMTILFTPVSFLVTVLRRRLARVGVADMVSELAHRSTVDSVESEMRRVLQDADLEVWQWDADEQRHVDARGRCVVALPDDRWNLPLSTQSGELLATVVLSPGLRRHSAVVHTAAAAARQALEIGRLQAQQLAEVRTSREKIIQASLAERQRIERDLHDGVQQSLLAAGARLAAARFGVEAGPARDALDEVRADLRMAARQVRDLAHGIYPRELSEFGLHAALQSMSDRCVFPVSVRVSARRFGSAIETTLYFVACEALNNAEKHSGASLVTITSEHTDDVACLRVVDDGRGGASSTQYGSGLAGMAGRLQAVDGRLRIDSVPGRGTVIVASVPCV